jgi:uncharacterized membrane protein YfcA
VDLIDLALSALAVVAGAVAAVSGFGIGSLLTPGLAVVIGTKAAVAVVAIPHAVATSVRLWGLRGAVDRAVLLSFGLASAAGGLLGALLHSAFSSPALNVILGGLLIAGGTLELTSLSRRVRLPETTTLLAGLASGLFGGLVGNQGGIRSTALLRFELAPQTLVATATATAILVDAVRLPIYLVTGWDDVIAQLPTIVMLTAGVILGTVLGAPALRRMPEATFRRVMGAILIVVGVVVIMGPALARP